MLLSPLLEKDSTEIADKILNSSKFFYLDRNIEYKKGEEIKSWSLDGLSIEPSSKRIIHTPSLRKIVGFVDTDNYGIEGLELYFNSTLEGTDGKLVMKQRQMEALFHKQIFKLLNNSW